MLKFKTCVGVLKASCNLHEWLGQLHYRSFRNACNAVGERPRSPVRARHAGLVERAHSAPPAVCAAEAAACVRVDKASFARSPKCNTLVDHRHALVLEQMRARVIDLLLGSSQDHHPGTCQVPRHRLDDVPGDVLAHRHACSHALQPDCWLRAPCRRKLSATASQLVFDACNAAWLGGSVLATRSSRSTHSALCVHRGGAICCLLATWATSGRTCRSTPTHVASWLS